MRKLFAVASSVSLFALAGCDAINRVASVQQCTDFFDYSRDEDLSGNDDLLKSVCECAVDREAQGRTPVTSVPERTNPELGSYRRQIPDCLAANGASASGVAALESSGHAPRAAVFNPDTGTVTQPSGEIMPDQVPAAPRTEMDDEFDNAMRAAEEARTGTGPPPTDGAKPRP